MDFVLDIVGYTELRITVEHFTHNLMSCIGFSPSNVQ